jgi:hypothetical protein
MWLDVVSGLQEKWPNIAVIMGKVIRPLQTMGNVIQPCSEIMGKARQSSLLHGEVDTSCLAHGVIESCPAHGEVDRVLSGPWGKSYSLLCPVGTVQPAIYLPFRNPQYPRVHYCGHNSTLARTFKRMDRIFIITFGLFYSRTCYMK